MHTSTRKVNVSVSEPSASPTLPPLLARSPIKPAPPVIEVAGWAVSGRSSTADLTLCDESPLAKVQVKAPWNGAMAAAIGVPHGRAARDQQGTLVAGSAPGEWLLIDAPGTSADIAGRMEALAGEAAGTGAVELVSVVDLTHGRAMMRLTGQRSAEVLAKVCGVDLSEDLVPDGAVFRSTVARLATDVIYQSHGRECSYVMHCERSSGQYLFDALLDAGAEFGIDIDGFTSPAVT